MAIIDHSALKSMSGMEICRQLQIAEIGLASDMACNCLSSVESLLDGLTVLLTTAMDCSAWLAGSSHLEERHLHLQVEGARPLQAAMRATAASGR